jgi:hypothetical protein
MDQHPSNDREHEPRFDDASNSESISLNQIQFDHQSRDPMMQNQRAENETMISNIMNQMLQDELQYLMDEVLNRSNNN